ncbi:MAG: hypothetical protein H7Z37_16795 [Pyrinomonadaceae bacterium]|nr:hypothetical protein [Pyrinomonadaceae bacterium]
MELKQEIISTIERIPEKYLAELNELVKDFSEKKSKPGLLRRLSEIKIDGPPDFSRNIDLYLSGEKKFDDGE